MHLVTLVLVTEARMTGRLLYGDKIHLLDSMLNLYLV